MQSPWLLYAVERAGVASIAGPYENRQPIMMYYFASGMEQRGPYSADELAAFALRPDTLVWCEGMENWQRMDSVPELVSQIPQAGIAPVLADAAPSPMSANVPDLSVLPIAVSASPPPSADAYSLQYQTAPATPPTSGLAIASLVLGIVSMLSMCLMTLSLFLGLPCAILAIVFGVLARQRIARGEYSGRGMALAGLICGSVYVGLLVLGVIALMIYFIVSMR